MEASKSTRGGRWLLVGKLALGLVLLVVVILVVTSMQNRGSSGAHGISPPTAAAVESTAVTTASTIPLTAFEQANADRAFLSAVVNVDKIAIHNQMPPTGKVSYSFGRKDEVGMPTTFLVTSEAKDITGATWYQVMVPARPNGTLGWLVAADVTTHEITHSVNIYLAEHRLDLLDRGELVRSYPIGVGTVDTPTPLGDYYVTTKMRPPSPNGIYGVLAIGISAFSDKLTNWPKQGQVGIHGTNEPDKVGTDVSHGCIRLRNEDILQLTTDVPLGTPVSVNR
jgi:lipoprotein-anchoring transpeptidase ErfK/SrfK